MTLDVLGNYLYFFEGTTRYVLEIQQKSVFNTYSTVYKQKYIAASNKYGY